MNNQLKSRLKSAPFIVVGLLILAAFAVLGIPKIISTADNLKTGITNDASGIFIPILSFLLILFLFIRYSKRFPMLTINRNGIVFSSLFNTKKHNWNEIENIELTGKKNFGTFLNTSLEAVTFNLKNGEVKHIWIEQYSNSSEIRVVLERVQNIVTDKSLSFDNLYFGIDTQQNRIEDIKLDEGEVFNDNYVLSQNGIMFYLFLAFPLCPLYFLFLKNSRLTWGIVLILSFVFLGLAGLTSYSFNYFILTDKYLVVKKNIWFWKKKFYKLENIKEIVIDMPHRAPICLRIINYNYETNAYPASSLRNKTWKRLLSRLEQKNITVRNEVPFLK